MKVLGEIGVPLLECLALALVAAEQVAVTCTVETANFLLDVLSVFFLLHWLSVVLGWLLGLFFNLFNWGSFLGWLVLLLAEDTSEEGVERLLLG